MARDTSRFAARTTRALLIFLVAAATPVVAAAAASLREQAPPGTLTFRTWVVYGFGTGTIYSPGALCDVRPDGTGLTRRSNVIGSISDPAWTRDGTALAFVTHDRPGMSLLRVTSATTWSPRTVARGQIRAPAWSPDGRRIAFESHTGSEDSVRVVNADGSGERVLVPTPAASPTWSPDGTRIAFTQSTGTSGGIWTANGDGSGRTRLTNDGAMPAWSPDGTRIAFIAQATPVVLTQQELFTVAPDGSARTQLSRLVEPSTSGPLDTALSRPAWSPDASSIAVARTQSLRSPRANGPPTVELFLVDARDGTQKRMLALDGIDDPAWRPGSSPSAAATRPCLIRAGASRRVRGTPYDDLIVGTGAAESFHGGAGNDWIHAGTGRDSVTGGSGSDTVWTGRGPDTVLVRDRTRDIVRCGEGRGDVGVADRRDVLTGSCRRVLHR